MFKDSAGEGHRKVVAAKLDIFFPASGNYNGTSLNNRGSNGNYWSSTYNSETNARNLNFNSSAVNPTNNNNRRYGFSVRAVQQLPTNLYTADRHPPRRTRNDEAQRREDDMAMELTREQLLIDLHAAWHMARRHKVTKHYVRVFDRRAGDNLQTICQSLYTRDYHPEPSSCFIVHRPKKREVFAAQFADRVVHHYYYNQTHRIFERTFIEDSYSCIQGRGTHYGIERLKQHIRTESQNYTRRCWVMNLDIRGYFMHIDRKILRDIAIGTLQKMATHKVSPQSRQTWQDMVDIDHLTWLTEQIVMLDPKTSCKVVGSPEEWDGLDWNKSLFHTPEGCGLPIGNLTSQLLSNVYLNKFDQFCKRELGCKHYGRYVDDAYVVSCDKEWLLSLIPRMDKFLQERLHLELHRGKTHLRDVRHGVEFLGGFVKPGCTYMSHAAVRRLRQNVDNLKGCGPARLYRSINSMLGVMCHFDSFKLRREIFLQEPFLRYGHFSEDMSRYILDRPT